MYKQTKLYGILKMKCPKCHKGDFFKGHPYRIKTLGEVKEKCDVCNQKFELETGFYQGSYYVSYALGVALFISVAVLHFIFKEKVSPISLMINFVIILFFLLPLIYALSKITWANFFIKFDKKDVKN